MSTTSNLSTTGYLTILSSSEANRYIGNVIETSNRFVVRALLGIGINVE